MSRALPLLFVFAGVSVAIAGWQLQARARFAELEQQRASECLANARASLEPWRKAVEQRVMGAAAMVAGDPRLRPMANNAELDEATLSDVLQDLRTEGRLDVVALTSAQGRVRAVVGAKGLSQVSLSGADGLTRAAKAEGPVAFSWGLEGRLLSMGATAVRDGDKVLGFVAVGKDLSAELPSQFAETCAQLALLSNDQVLTAAEGPAKTVLSQLALTPSVVPVRLSGPGGTHWLGQTFEVEGAQPPLRFGLASKVAAGSHAFLLWAPVAAMVLLAAFALFIALRAGK